MDKTKHIVCYSGGHSSALVAIEVSRRFGKEDMILLNHDIHPSVESGDIKRFKREVSEYLGVPITFANHPEWDSKDQFGVVLDAQAFKVGSGTALCTNRLKTAPFEKWLKENFPDKNCVIYYGFDAKEKIRIQRRSSILASMGYRSDYPLALWDRTIQKTEDIGISPPNVYSQFKHANCIGCLKAGRQHWYVVFCIRPDIFEKAKSTEEAIGYSIIKGAFLDEIEPQFKLMKEAGVIPTEHVASQTFWKQVNQLLASNKGSQSQLEFELPCECVF